MKNTEETQNSAFEFFKTYINSKVTISDSDFEKIREVGKIKKLRKKQYLLQEGDLWQHYAFVCSGCLRTYTVDEKSAEHIIKFSIENWWAGDREALLNITPSKYNIDALEESILIMIKREDMDNLFIAIPEFLSMINNLINRTYIAAQNRVNDAMTFSTEERYNQFIQKFPDIFNRVPLHMIASYLGVSAERLSRIRSLSAKK
ncbi:cAMP-binding domain of CRP or a regulatory subunit of cAMP-dependent protein kinases [Flavobacterium sp. CF108]|uniref:Crp/Fnr family transcriptional regulator n=1 Tax=unclassified Flavobacterium TaxID=196869 RepID=UPI0008AFC2BB|nr:MULTISPECIES: Crp/Fnr family transcriptional regulator [unclassified Flavobacterium]SEO17318.1 cAMP-binding domain of CRP or a regulatory subunit of cAMP-dependent protein kinases [Flavobacterium sp. fv08]SHG55832.1 cAMP-binding domain of CRP or a regulatory subunit of cAMP-dependent protein kinases [Flavobacterium sp. CF108]